MSEYPKIQSIFKRDELTHKFLSEFSLPEFEYLQLNIWEFTEKIDGTNIRIIWDSRIAGEPLVKGKYIPLDQKLESAGTEPKMVMIRELTPRKKAEFIEEPEDLDEEIEEE